MNLLHFFDTPKSKKRKMMVYKKHTEKIFLALILPHFHGIINLIYETFHITKTVAPFSEVNGPCVTPLGIN